MRMIDADVALSRVKPYEPSDETWTCTGGTAIRLIHNAIDNTPTVDAAQLMRLENDSMPTAHVVTVVFCKDCKYRRKNYYNEPYCINKDGLSDPYDDCFCSYGEK